MKQKISDKKQAVLISSISAFIAGLCCFSPIVVVLLGLGSVTFASSLADTLYGEYKWYFRLSGFLFMCTAYVYWYYTSTKSCSLDQKKKQQKKILNLFLLSIFGFITFYIIWLYGVVDLLGRPLGLW